MRRRFPEACFNTVSSAQPFPQVVSALAEFIGLVLGVSVQDLDPSQFLFCTCGDWDVRSMIPRQCNNPLPGAVDFELQDQLFSRWCNLKELFRDHYRLPPSQAPTGMRGMLRRLRIDLQGQHHLGMDDVTNLSKILKIFVSEGARIEATGIARRRFSQGKGSGRGMKGDWGKGGKRGKGGKGDKGGHGGYGGPDGCWCSGKGTKGKESDSLMSGSTTFDIGAPADGAKSKAAGPPPEIPPPPVPEHTAEVQGEKGGPDDLDDEGEGECEARGAREELRGFLSRAPIPGGEWKCPSDEDGEEEEGLDADVGRAAKVRKVAAGDAGLLAGVLSSTHRGENACVLQGVSGASVVDSEVAEAGAVESAVLPETNVEAGGDADEGIGAGADTEAEPPGKVPRITSLLAHLPPPKMSA